MALYLFAQLAEDEYLVAVWYAHGRDFYDATVVGTVVGRSGVGEVLAVVRGPPHRSLLHLCPTWHLELSRTLDPADPEPPTSESYR